MIKVGGMCDRTGTSKVIGIETCPGVADYIALINRKGGVLGHKINYTEIDHAYMVDRAVEAYGRLKQEGAVTMMSYGVPTLYGLTSRFMDDRIPAFNTGTGRSDAIDGVAWPYIFPGTASYWSQAGAAMKYIKDNGAKQGTKIAFIYYDNPAGREGLPMVEAVAQKEGYVLRKFAVQPPGLEMAPQVNDIARDFKADWVIGSLFGNAAAVSIKEFAKAGFPLNRVVSFVYGAGDADVEAAGWDIAQGYLGLQYAAVGPHPSRDPGNRQDVSGRGQGAAEIPRQRLLQPRRAARRVDRRRHPARDSEPRPATDRRQGAHGVRGDQELRPAGVRSPSHARRRRITRAADTCRVYQVKGNEWVPVSGWIRGYRDEVMALVKQANSK